MKSRIINIREADQLLHKLFMEWWGAHGWPGVALVILPKCGIMVESDAGLPLAAGWLYMANDNGVCMLEWVVTNPANGPKVSVEAIKCLLDSARVTAAGMDYGVMLTAVKQPSLIRLYEREGFVKADEGMTHMVMRTKETD